MCRPICCSAVPASELWGVMGATFNADNGRLISQRWPNGEVRVFSAVLCGCGGVDLTVYAYDDLFTPNDWDDFNHELLQVEPEDRDDYLYDYGFWAVYES